MLSDSNSWRKSLVEMPRALLKELREEKALVRWQLWYGIRECLKRSTQRTSHQRNKEYNKTLIKLVIYLIQDLVSGDYWIPDILCVLWICSFTWCMMFRKMVRTHVDLGGPVLRSCFILYGI